MNTQTAPTQPASTWSKALAALAGRNFQRVEAIESSFSEEELNAAMDPIYARGDLITKKFVLCHAALSLALAFFYQTWLVSLVVASAATAMFFLSVTLLPRTFTTRCIAGLSLQTFVALHIYQMHGMAEMHFFFFTAFTILIVYQDWKSMWPGTFFIIVQHTMFAVIHNAGVDLYFFEDRYVGALKLTLHLLIASAQVAICGYWAFLLRRQTLHDARQKKHLREASRASQQAREEAEAAQKEAEAARLEAESAREEAERANSAKSEFLSRMSHELRTPMNAILGFGQLLEMSSLPESERESVEHIMRGGNHLLGLINEVLDMARVESGHLHIAPEPVSVSQCVQGALSLVRPLAQERGITLDASMALASPHFVLADAQRLKQVLLNLLSNAIKYNRDNGWVSVSCVLLSNGRLKASVTDSGLGIAPEDLPRLFSPFERLNAADTGIEGTGLGLAFSRRMAEAMDGVLQVESVPGQGSTFWIELPLSHIEAQSESLSGTALSQAPSTWSLEVPKSLETHTVLCIEDNAANFKLVERALTRRPWLKLLNAANGEVGLAMAWQSRPDLILLDLNLPDIMGDEILRRLRASAATREARVVVVSADANESQRKKLLDAGADGYITKPFDIHELRRTVDSLQSSLPLRGTIPLRDAA